MPPDLSPKEPVILGAAQLLRCMAPSDDAIVSVAFELRTTADIGQLDLHGVLLAEAEPVVLDLEMAEQRRSIRLETSGLFFRSVPMGRLKDETFTIRISCKKRGPPAPFVIRQLAFLPKPAGPAPYPDESPKTCLGRLWASFLDILSQTWP